MPRYSYDPTTKELQLTSSGGGRHTIVNEQGTAMLTRKNLKFLNASILDDSANNTTIVSVEGESLQFSTMPTAGETWLNKIVQFIGTTGNDYTNGYFYKCISYTDDQENTAYRWDNIPVQTPAGISMNYEMIAPVEDDATSSSRAYSVGEQLIIEDTLYDVIDDIEIGDALVEDTNIEESVPLTTKIATTTSNYVGTRADWELLSDAEKAQYETCDFTDDYSTVEIDNVPTENSSNLVKSSGVYTALSGKQDALTFDNAPTESSNNVVKSGGVYTALSGKQDTLTFDNAPTENSNNPVKSGGIYTALNNKQDVLTFDNSPTESSNNPVKSGGVYTALSNKQDTLTFDDTPTESSNNVVKSGGVYTALSGKQDALTFDSTPTESSTNPVESGGVYTALSGKQDALTFDNTPTENSNNPVKSGGVYSALSGKQDALTFDNVPTESSNNVVKSGGVYTALSGKQDTLIFDETPTESSNNPVKSGGVYSALSNKQNALTFDSVPTSNSTNPVESGGIYTALSGKQDTLTFDNVPTDSSNNPVKSGGVYTELSKKQDTIQLLTIPAASESYFGKTVQFIGTTGNGYIHNYFYECVSDGEPTPTYSWTPVSVQATEDGMNYEMIAPVESDPTSSANVYSVGDQLIIDGVLYDVITDIDIGDALVEDTNIEESVPLTTRITGNYVGTKAAWDLMSLSEKAKYTTCDFTDYFVDGGSSGPAVATNNYVGTLEAFNNLSASDKAQYTTLDTTDDINGFFVDNVPTAGSQSVVKSGGIYSAIQEVNTNLSNEASARATLGAHNYNGGVFSSQVTNGFTVTANSDGSVTVVGSNTSAGINIDSTTFILKAGTYILNENPLPIIGSEITNRTNMAVLTALNNNHISPLPLDDKKAKTFTLASDTLVKVRLYVYKTGTGVIQNVTFKPMIRLATDADSTYQPYAMTNRELTELSTVKTDTPAVASGITNNLKIRKYGKIVNICGYFASDSNLDTDTTYITLSSGFRPQETTYVDTPNFLIRMDSDGIIYITSIHSSASRAYMNCSFVVS